MEYISQPLIFQGTFVLGEHQQAEIKNCFIPGGLDSYDMSTAPDICGSGPLHKTTKVSQIKILKGSESLVIRMLVKNIHPWVAFFLYIHIKVVNNPQYSISLLLLGVEGYTFYWMCYLFYVRGRYLAGLCWDYYLWDGITKRHNGL